MDINKKLSSLNEISKAKLSKILSANPNRKYIVFEPRIIRPLERICGIKWLKGNGIEKIFKLEPKIEPQHFGQFPVFYLIYNNVSIFKQVADQIRSQIDEENPPKNRFHIIVVPNILPEFEDEFEEWGLLHTAVNLHSFQWMPIHLDTGILTLELPSIYKTLQLKQNYQFLPSLSKTLWQLYFVIGKPKFTISLGHFSNMISKQLEILAEGKGQSDKLECDFGGVLIMDRQVDYCSPLLTPGTYSALLNEVYGINCGVCEYKDDLVRQKTLNPVVKKEEVSFSLDSNLDGIYKTIKNLYFTEVTTVLSNLTKELQSERDQSKHMALDEIKKYVQTKLQETKTRKKQITNHLLAAETIINVLGPRYEQQQEIEANLMKNSSKSQNFAFLDELICTENSKQVSLRLFCLMCATQKLTDTEIRSFFTKYFYRFGFNYGNAYRNMIFANLIQEATDDEETSLTQSKIRLPKFSNKDSFYTNANKLRQIPSNPDKVNLKHPTCPSYVFGGSYIPLVTQICNLILNRTPLEEIKSSLMGLGQSLSIENNQGYPMDRRSVLVFVVGGVSYAEIAACNFLEIVTRSKIVLMSDRIISGNDLMGEMLT